MLYGHASRQSPIHPKLLSATYRDEYAGEGCMWLGLEGARLAGRGLSAQGLALRVQVPHNHILTQILYYSYYYPKPTYSYLILGTRTLWVEWGGKSHQGSQLRGPFHSSLVLVEALEITFGPDTHCVGFNSWATQEVTIPWSMMGGPLHDCCCPSCSLSVGGGSPCDPCLCKM